VNPKPAIRDGIQHCSCNHVSLITVSKCNGRDSSSTLRTDIPFIIIPNLGSCATFVVATLALAISGSEILPILPKILKQL